MIQLEVNGVVYSSFISGFVSSRLDALSNTFSFVTTSDKGRPLPFRGGESCRVIVDNELVLTGSIEVVSVNYGPREHSISISGRDKTGDLLDSSLDNFSDDEIIAITGGEGAPIIPTAPGVSQLRGAGDVRSPITLVQLIEIVVAKIQLDISVSEGINTFGIELFNKAEDIFSIKSGENAFRFIEKAAKKRQVLLTSDAEGNIIVGKPSGTEINATLQNILNSETNNIISGAVTYDTTGRFRRYDVVSSLNPLALNLAGAPDLAAVVSQSGRVFDKEIRISRQLVFSANSSSSAGQAIPRAQWEANIRKTRGRLYSVDVQGHSNPTGALWKIGTVVTVKDDFAGINDQMLINQVDFKLANNGGSITSLALVDKQAYTLALEEPKAQSNSQGLGLGLT